ncbi:MAG: hypothetical protein WDZ81_00680 [Candidatus Saccharimonadales bacterium]
MANPLTNPGADKGSKAKQAFAFLKRHKKGTAAGVGGGGIVAAIITFVVLLSGTQLIWMNQIMQDFNFGPHDRSAASRANRIKNEFSKIKSSNTDLGRNANNLIADSQLDRVSSIGEAKVVSHQRRDPFRRLLGSRSGGQIEWRLFRGLPRSSPEYQSPRNKMLGISESDILQGSTNVEEEVKSEDGETNTDETKKRPVNDEGVDSVREATERIKQEPHNSRRISQSAARSIKGGAIVIGLITTCLAQNYDALTPSEKERYEMLITTGGNFLTSGSQYQTQENVHSDEIVDITEAYTDTVEYENEEGKLVSESRSFTDSAAWKRATGQPTTGEEPDSELSFDRNFNLLSSTLLGIGGAINDNFLAEHPTRIFCKVIQTKTVGTALLVGDAVLSWLGGPISRAAFVAVEAGLRIAMPFLIEQLAFEQVIPEGPAMLLATNDMGLNLGQAEFARSQGAPPISNAEVTAMRASHQRSLAQEDQQRGVQWRYLSPENPRSALSKVAMNVLPTQLTIPGTVKKIASIPTSLFKNMFKPFSVQAENHIEEFNNYGIQQYGFTEGDVEIDVAENAQIVEKALSCAGNPDGTGCTEEMVENGQQMQEILEKCIETGKRYYELDDFCKTAEGQKRENWVSVGLWKYDESLIESLACLSHDQPCGSSVSPTLNPAPNNSANGNENSVEQPDTAPGGGVRVE